MAGTVDRQDTTTKPVAGFQQEKADPGQVKRTGCGQPGKTASDDENSMVQNCHLR